MSVAWPVGLQADDVAILAVRVMNAVGGSPVISTPAGWTQIAQQNMSTTSFAEALFWKRLDGSETGNQSVSTSVNSASGLDGYCLAICVYRGCVNTGTPVELGGMSWNTGNLSSAVSPLREIAGADRTIINYYALRTNSGLTITAGDGFTRRVHQADGSARPIALTERQLTQPQWTHEIASISDIALTGFSYATIALIPQTVVSSTTPILDDAHLSDVVFLGPCDGLSGELATYNLAFADQVISKSGTGTCNIATGQSKFGGASLARVSSATLLKAVNGAAHTLLGSSNFTIELWAYWSAVATDFECLFGQWDSGASQRSWALGRNGGNLQLFLSTTGTTTTSAAAAAWVPTTGQWYHIAGTWDGTAYRTFANGVMVGKSTTAVSPLLASTVPISLGAALNSGAASGSFTGYIDEIRVTKGTARYASDSGFAVPTAAFPRG
jgi:hypothetical protein